MIHTLSIDFPLHKLTIIQDQEAVLHLSLNIRRTTLVIVVIKPEEVLGKRVDTPCFWFNVNKSAIINPVKSS